MIQRVEPADWKPHWDIHLDALKTDPDCFKGSYDYCSSISDQTAKDHTAKQSSGPTEASFLAWIKDKPIGEITIHLTDPGTARIVFLWVRPEYRQEDVGTKLMEMAESWALDQNPDLTYFDLVVQPGNHEAIEFYEKLGYKASNVCEGEEVVMHKTV